MKQTLAEYRTFFREFRETFHTTGAIAPSGKSLCRATVRPMAEHQGPKRVLEVGSGTGAVTREIVKHIHPGDHFDAVELNERFVGVLNYLFDHEAQFKKVKESCRVLHMAVQDVPTDDKYDYIVCCVPFNNFSVALTREIFRHMLKLLKPGGTLSFFEYLWIRGFKVLLANKTERKRLTGIAQVLGRYLRQYEFKCDTAWVNMPPAMVHHLRFDPEADPKPRKRRRRKSKS